MPPAHEAGISWRGRVRGPRLARRLAQGEAFAGVPDGGPPPLPQETPSPPRLAPLAPSCTPACPVTASAVATPIGLPNPSTPLMPAPRSPLGPCRRGVAPWANAIGAVQAVLLVERFPRPRD